MPGIRITAGADIQVSNIRIEVGADGTVVPHPFTWKLRTDMWPAWLFEAFEAAEQCQKVAAAIPAAVEGGNENEITKLLMSELRTAMRSITAAAFSVDALYTSIKVRSPEHPDQQRWMAENASRSTQVIGSFRHHLKLKNATTKEVAKRIKTLFRYRGWAVHPGSQFREPIYRDDIDAGVDWHHAAFRGDNAVNLVALTVSMIDFLVSRMDQGNVALKSFAAGARQAMDEIFARYELTNFPSFDRAVSAADSHPIDTPNQRNL